MMEVTAGSAKRPFEEAGDQTRKAAAANGDETPPKAVTTRRLRFLPKPPIPPDRKKEGGCALFIRNGIGIVEEQLTCQRTYASVTAPGSSEESADLLIDEADSEEAASPASAREGAPSTSSSPPPGQPEKHPLAASVREPEDAPARAAVAASARKATAQGHYARIS
ncbi:hypothetical protein HPB52_023708 [Rhipicephalus sanguineus]|uniref:Uncharacterized protein n=1 Tax=Rhipicephalus sanguineus TaxID=34632 RepID=A0A9D4YR65_RHISA|nr:hypothetical protein HPB52_023708 [Rhipicephalus sanguineus]